MRSAMRSRQTRQIFRSRPRADALALGAAGAGCATCCAGRGVAALDRRDAGGGAGLRGGDGSHGRPRAGMAAGAGRRRAPDHRAYRHGRRTARAMPPPSRRSPAAWRERAVSFNSTPAAARLPETAVMVPLPIVFALADAASRLAPPGVRVGMVDAPALPPSLCAAAAARARARSRPAARWSFAAVTRRRRARSPWRSRRRAGARMPPFSKATRPRVSPPGSR